MNISIIGGGNIGTLMAADIADKGHCVTILSSKPEKWSNTIAVLDADGNEIRNAQLSRITSSYEEAVTNADYIFVAMPAERFSIIKEEMLPFVKEGQRIGIVPGAGGAEFVFSPFIEKKAVLFGLQRVHSIARLEEYGHSVHQLGRKDSIQIASIPHSSAPSISKDLSSFFDMPVEILDNYLDVTLTPSNPILHTSRLYSMFRDWHEGMYYPENIPFYEEWTDHSSDTLIKMDEELQELCSVIPLDLKGVKSLKDHYESHSIKAMTSKISGIKAFKGILSPMKGTEGGWIPDFTSRYFTTDFPYGLKIIKDIASLFEVATPMMDRVWDWFLSVSPQKDYPNLISNMTKETFVALYEQK